MKSSARSTPCPTVDDLRRFLREELDEAAETSTQEHVGGCTTCQLALERAAGDAELWSGVSRHLGEGDDGDVAAADAELAEVTSLLGPSDDPAMMGRLGHYEICGLIGRGSTGYVLKALEPRLNRYVAIKLMAPTYRSSGVARKRFEREGRAVAAVSHEHVVPIHAVDEQSGLPYIVMQYVPGLSLQERIDRDGPLDTCEVTRIGLQVAKALAAAHAQGIVHRDVKPANVILENTVDRAMVTDFGLARVADDVAMTRSGTIAGTPQYMSPEQAKGDVVDTRSDLFSLGSLMYAACTGRPPFRAETVFGVINRVCESEPQSIRELNPEIRGWLGDFVAKLMRKGKDDRFQDAGEVSALLSAELAHLQNPTGVALPPRAWRATKSNSRKRRLIVGALGTAALVVGAAVVLDEEHEPTDRSQRKSEANVAALSAAPSATSNGEASPEVFSLLEDAEVEWAEVPSDAEGAGPLFEETLRESIVVIPGDTLTLRIDRGLVEVFPSGSEHVTIEVQRRVVADDVGAAAALIHHHDLRLEPVDTGLALLGGFHDHAQADRFAHVAYRVGIPDDYHADLEAEAGDFVIGDLQGNVIVESGEGDIELGRIGGSVEVSTRAGLLDMTRGCGGTAEVDAILGDVRLANLDGDTEVRTSGGRVWLGPSAGFLDVQTGGSDVIVDGIGGPMFVFASSADVSVAVHDDPIHNSEFTAADGEVTIALASHVATSIEARGELESALPYETRASEDGVGDPWSVSTVNGGGVPLRAVSTTGLVRVATFEPEDVEEAAASGGSGSGGSGLGGSGLGGSGLGGSGLGGSGGSGELSRVSQQAWEKTQGEPRPGGLVTIPFDEPMGRMDGYTLYLPVSHDAQRNDYPVLVFLQGAYGVGGEIGNINHWGLPRLLRDEENLESERNQLLLDTFIVASPHIQEGQYYHEPEAVQRIVDQVVDTYGGDPDRVYLTGLSRGGHGTWGLAARLPNTFAAIAPVGSSPSGVEDYGSLASTAVWIAHNRADQTTEYADVLDASRRVEDACDAQFLRLDFRDVETSSYLDRSHVFTNGSGGGHDAWTELYTSAAFYRWLLAHEKSRGEDPF